MKVGGFANQVYQACARIPRGKVSTYGWIARASGYPGAARAVGNALNKNPYAPRVPCHRVVKGDGTLGGFGGGEVKKIKLLKKEGVRVKKNRIVDFNQILYKF